MLAQVDLAYYQKRERQARELAAGALDPQIRAIHLEMAERYAKLQAGDELVRVFG